MSKETFISYIHDKKTFDFRDPSLNKLSLSLTQNRITFFTPEDKLSHTDERGVKQAIYI